MITLSADCLLFQLSTGEGVPFSAEMISVELMGNTGQWLDPELVKQAAKAVFHYFKHELGRHSVSSDDFAATLERVLHGFRTSAQPEPQPPLARPSGVVEADLWQLARQTREAGELMFFPRLRDELRLQLRQRPGVLRFHSLRSCVKHLVGAERWGLRCRCLEEQIVQYLRQCLSSESAAGNLALIVE